MLMRRLFVTLALVAAIVAAEHGVRAQTISTPGCYNITATAVTITTTSCASPSPSPTPAPTPTPTPNPGVFQGFINGQPQPTGWRPFPNSQFFSSPLPTITPGYYTSDSATIVAEQWTQSATSMGQSLHNQEPGAFDVSVPVYAATASPVLVNIVNPSGGNNNGVTGGVPASLLIPQSGQPTQSVGLESNLSTLQADGTEVDFAVTTNASPATLNPPLGFWRPGNTMAVASYGQTCSNFYSGTGIGNGQVSTTTMGQCGIAGLTGINDLQRGEIDHTLIVYTNCVASGYVTPSVGATSAIPASICTDGVGPKLGYTMWYDVPCSTTQATTMQPWAKAILCALNTYGGLVGGTLTGGTIGAGGGGSSGQFGFTIGLESSEPFYAYGQGDKFAVMFNQGWIGRTASDFAPGFQRWIAQPQDANGNTVPGANFASHIHYINSCVKAQTC
jgi:hypothetical protein